MANDEPTARPLVNGAFCALRFRITRWIMAPADIVALMFIIMVPVTPLHPGR